MFGIQGPFFWGYECRSMRRRKQAGAHEALVHDVRDVGHREGGPRGNRCAVKSAEGLGRGVDQRHLECSRAEPTSGISRTEAVREGEKLVDKHAAARPCQQTFAALIRVHVEDDRERIAL